MLWIDAVTLRSLSGSLVRPKDLVHGRFRKRPHHPAPIPTGAWYGTAPHPFYGRYVRVIKP